MKILLVDDEKLFLDFLSNMIRMSGHEVVLAENGKQALEKLEQESSVDAVVTDFQMRDVDGIVLTREVKKKNPNIRVVMVSASFDDDSKKAAINAGARFALDKTSKDLVPNIIDGISCTC